MDAPKATRALARGLRKAMSPPEARLWVTLRDHRLEGLKFRRQHPVGPYVLDFYCEGARLAVEVDGEGHGHGDQPARDARRDAWIGGHGIRTLRIPAIEVRDNLEGVVTTILGAASQPPSWPSAVFPPTGGEKMR